MSLFFACKDHTCAIAACESCILHSLGPLNVALYLRNKLQSHSACLKGTKLCKFGSRQALGITGEQYKHALLNFLGHHDLSLPQMSSMPGAGNREIR
eukprot:s1182_g42.t1